MLIKSHLQKSHLKDIKIIALSAMDSGDIITKARSAGFDEYRIHLNSMQAYSNENSKATTY